MNPNDLFPIAIHMLICMADEPRKYFTVEELSQAVGLKVTTTRRILRAFKRLAVVKLKVGKANDEGGWILAKHPREISLRAAYEASGVTVLPPLTLAPDSVGQMPLNGSRRISLPDSSSSKAPSARKKKEALLADENPVAGAVNSLLVEAEALLVTRFERVSLKDLQDQVRIFKTHSV